MCCLNNFQIVRMIPIKKIIKNNNFKYYLIFLLFMLMKKNKKVASLPVKSIIHIIDIILKLQMIDEDLFARNIVTMSIY